ncbi:hypothetical protein A1OE_1511 [Candidatus Endolissoclinum faulkneri L2]|uniref:Uncharacterized protein n=1 Tax=Candidatus Endolissoclinum faulkneri L2 TaxID=1193729 RepID=K7YJ58_9PROT|nr:hypothetical protein A1OE_1511 [Candidatus Endolissoclinum faulkneri L2]
MKIKHGDFSKEKNHKYLFFKYNKITPYHYDRLFFCFPFYTIKIAVISQKINKNLSSSEYY